MYRISPDTWLVAAGYAQLGLRYDGTHSRAAKDVGVRKNRDNIAPLLGSRGNPVGDARTAVAADTFFTSIRLFSISTGNVPLPPLDRGRSSILATLIRFRRRGPPRSRAAHCVPDSRPPNTHTFIRAKRELFAGMLCRRFCAHHALQPVQPFRINYPDPVTRVRPNRFLASTIRNNRQLVYPALLMSLERAVPRGRPFGVRTRWRARYACLVLWIPVMIKTIATAERGYAVNTGRPTVATYLALRFAPVASWRRLDRSPREYHTALIARDTIQTIGRSCVRTANPRGLTYNAALPARRTSRITASGPLVSYARVSKFLQLGSRRVKDGRGIQSRESAELRVPPHLRRLSSASRRDGPGLAAIKSVCV